MPIYLIVYIAVVTENHELTKHGIFRYSPSPIDRD